MHLPLPELNGQAITGSYSTGAKGIAIADALTAAKRTTFNAYAAKTGLKQISTSVATGANRISAHVPGSKPPVAQQQPDSANTTKVRALPASAATHGDDSQARAERVQQQRASKRKREQATINMCEQRDQTFHCPHEGCNRRCLSKVGLALHMDVCEQLGPRARKHQRKQHNDLATEVTLRRPAAAAVSTGDSPAGARDHEGDMYLLCGGKVTLYLPRPEPWPMGWAVRPARIVVRKTKAQMLFLLEEFVINKQQGRHARVSELLLQALAERGPELTLTQLQSHMSVLESNGAAQCAGLAAVG